MTANDIDTFLGNMIAAHGIQKSIDIIKNNIQIASLYESQENFDRKVFQSWHEVLNLLETLAKQKNDNMLH